MFISSTGDELLLSPTGEMGWLLHDTREIKPDADTFEEMLTKLSNEERSLGPWHQTFLGVNGGAKFRGHNADVKELGEIQ